jgi:glycine oxidase
MSGLPARSEVVVVGGGIVGLAVAYELARRRREVLVLDRDDVPGVATRAAAGMLAPTSEADLTDRSLVDLELDSLGRYPAFVAGIEGVSGQSCGHRTEGTLWVALNRDQDGELDRLFSMQRSKGLAARRLSPEAVLAREPHLSGRIVGGLLAEEDHQVDPRALSAALGTALTRLAGRVATGCRATRVEHAAGRVEGVSGVARDSAFRVAADTVVLAAGAWSEEVVAPVAPLGLRPVKGQLVRLAGPELATHVVRSPDVYLVPRRGGELLVGATMEEQGLDALPTAGAVLDLLREAWRILPGVYDLAVTELSVGFRPVVRDHRPVIGATSTRGLFVATGHFRNGVLLAPATAHYLAGWIADGVAPTALAPFGVERLEAPRRDGPGSGPPMSPERPAIAGPFSGRHS